MEQKLCECGCGLTIPKFDNRGRLRKRIQKHSTKGLKHTQEAIKMMSENRKGKCLKEANPKWKSEDISYVGLHVYIRKYLPQKEFCEICFKVPPEVVANITGIYNKELKNWARMCRSCHTRYDNIITRRNIIYHKNTKRGIERIS